MAHSSTPGDGDPTGELHSTANTHITITTYNVVSARGAKLLMALRAMADINTDIALLTETKLCGDRHTRQGHGYSVFASDAASCAQGGVALVWKTTGQHWMLEGMRAVSANVISATLVSGTQRWLIIGAYLSPNCKPDDELTAIETEYRRNPRLPVIWLGDFNADFGDDTCERTIAISTTAQHLGVEDVQHKFHQQKYRKHTFQRRLRDRTYQRSRCDYILVDPALAVRSLRVVNPPRYHSDHLALKMQLHSSTVQAHRQYLNNWSLLPSVQAAADEGLPNAVFQQLLTHHERQIPSSYPPRDAWIAQDTWQLIDRRTAALKRHAPQPELRALRKAIRKKIKRDRSRRLQVTGDEIQAHLDANETTEAWRLVKIWYRRYAKASPPTPMDLHRIAKEYRDLYTCRPPEGEPIRGMVSFSIPDEIPNEEEMASALRSLRSGRAPGPSGMTVEDLKKWHAARETNLAPWLLMLWLVTHAFQTGVVPTRVRSNTMVLIPKPEPGQVRGIGLLEPVWKLISAIVNRRLMSFICFHDDLHGFLPGRGTGTACLEAKLESQLAYRSGRPLYHVYLDFSKAYDSIDRASTLRILEDYGVGPRILRLLEHFWGRHVIIPRQHAFFGDPFPARRGLTTGDIPAPVIFNIVIDAVLRRWYAETTAQGMATRAQFYADDGSLRDHNPNHLQAALANMEALFLRVGLKINGKKTKVLTVLPTEPTITISTAAYKRRMEGEGETYLARKRCRISCPVCEVTLQANSLPGHYRALHPGIIVPRPGQQPLHPVPEPAYYVVSEPDKHASVTCPVASCGVCIVGGWYALR